MPGKYKWGSLSKQQKGAFAEYFVKMEFTMYGFQVYRAEVDDRGIDFVTRHNDGPFIRVQVKSLYDYGYTCLEKSKFKLGKDLYLAFGFLREGQPPALYLIPSLSWLSPDGLLKDRTYEGKESAPEWGLNLSRKNLAILEKYMFENIIETLKTLSL